MKLGLGLSLANRGGAGGISSPIPSSGLSLWLKADAGVSRASYNYVSQIIISGTSTPNLNGTYTAIGVPEFDTGENRPVTYGFYGPTGKELYWNVNTGLFTVYSEDYYGSFSSSNGQTWTPNTIISEFVITGFTGIYSGANGTYNYLEEGYYERNEGGFFVQGNTLYDSNYEIPIATNNNNYLGAWTPEQYFSTITLSSAGTTSVNGVYTRTDSALDLFGIGFSASGGRSILYDDNDGFWYTSPSDDYRNFGDPSGTWTIENGASPAPTAVYSNSNRNVGSPTSTATIVPTGSISGSVTTATALSNSVIGWADQSGNGRNVVSDGENPGYNLSAINSKPAIEFFSSALIGSIGFNFASNNTLFIVFKARSVTAGALWGQGNGEFISAVTNGYTQISNSNVSAIVSSNVASSINTPYLFSSRNSSSNFQLYLNGNSTGTATYNSFSGASTNQYIGADYNNGSYEYFYNGYISEIIVYNRAITTTERQQVEAYLMGKYAI